MFTVWWKPRASRPEAPVAVARVCVIASTAAVGNAIARNRAKRRLREVFRQQQHLLPAECDLLLIARGSATAVPMRELQRKFSEACAQITSKLSNPGVSA